MTQPRIMDVMAKSSAGSFAIFPALDSAFSGREYHNVSVIMRTVVYGAGGLWWSDLKPGSTLDHRLQLVQASLGDAFSACLNAGL